MVTVFQNHSVVQDLCLQRHTRSMKEAEKKNQQKETYF